MNNNIVKIIDQCRACGSSNLMEFLRFQNLPIAGLYFSKQNIERGDVSLPLSLSLCEQCGLVQTRETISSDIYSEYLFVGVFSQSYVEHLNWVADYLVQEKGIKRKKVLEIGCSDGYLLQKLKESGNNDVFGYEPSNKLAEACRKRGVIVSESYFPNATLPEGHNKHDVIIIRHVLEHIDNLRNMLEAINASVKHGGIIVVEVPDVEEIFDKKLYSNIFHQHLNYFSFFSISNLFKRYGFYVSFFKKVLIHGGSVILIFEKDRSKKINTELINISFSDCVAFTNSLNKYYTVIRKLVNDCIAKDIKVYGYGAAERTFSILGMTKLTNKEIVKIYDKNTFLHNKFIPISRIMIDSPDNIQRDDIDCLIIFATSYEEEILNEIKVKYKFKGKVISIKGEPKIFSI